MDIQVSLARILAGDNSRTAPVYSDTEIRETVTLGPARPTEPAALRLCGMLTARRYPSDVTGGPWKLSFAGTFEDL